MAPQALSIEEVTQVKSDAPFFRRRRKRLCATCCAITCCLVVLVVVVVVILAFTVFKVKKPRIHVESVSVQSFTANIEGILPPRVSVNLTLDVVVSVENPNKASFRYTNSTADIFYRGDEVGYFPIPSGEIASNGMEQISSTLVVLADRLVATSDLLSDFRSGYITFTTTTDISGRVKILIIKKHVDTSTECNVTVSVGSRSVNNTVCSYRIRL